MSASKRGFGSNLARIDAHEVAPAEFEEIPELTDDHFERADLYDGARLVRRGRPPSENARTAISLRVDADVVERFGARARLANPHERRASQGGGVVGWTVAARPTLRRGRPHRGGASFSRAEKIARLR